MNKGGTEVYSEHIFLVEVNVRVHIHRHIPLDLCDKVNVLREGLKNEKYLYGIFHQNNQFYKKTSRNLHKLRKTRRFLVTYSWFLIITIAPRNL